MYKDPTEFRKRFAKWKAGAKPYQYGIPYEDDSHNTDYDQARANLLGYERDGTGHLPTRDYETGRFLKSPAHPTVSMGVLGDMNMGYDVWYNNKDKSLYSQPNFTSTYKDRLPRFATGTEGGYKYSWNSDTQSWDRYTADLMGEVFNDLVITPSSNRRRFDYEKQPAILHSPKIETDSQYTQRRIREELNRRTWRSDIADAISLVIGFTPAGNVELGLNTAAAAARGNYGEAAMLGAGILLPGMFRNTYKAVKAIKPITKKALRYSPEEELLANESWKEIMDNEGWYTKWVRGQFEDDLPLIDEVEDISKQVIDKAGSPDFYPALEDALSYPMKRVFGKNTMRREVARDILSRLGYPAVSRNLDLLLDGKPFSEFIPWQIKSGEKYDPLAYDISRVYKSSVENALPYLVDAIPDLMESQVKDILERIPWAKSYLAQRGAIQKSGKPFLTYLPDNWDGSTNIIELMHPSRVKQNIKWKIPSLDMQKKDELMKQYSLFKKIYPSEQMKYTTGDGATILIDPESKTSAAYFNPETALRDAQNDFDRLFPGESWALVDNGALSADSYTLLEALTRRHSNSGTIHIPRKPDGTVSMQRLNTMGKYRTIKHVKKAVSNLRNSTGIDLPDPYERDGHIYAPNFYWTKNL